MKHSSLAGALIAAGLEPHKICKGYRGSEWWGCRGETDTECPLYGEWSRGTDGSVNVVAFYPADTKMGTVFITYSVRETVKRFTLQVRALPDGRTFSTWRQGGGVYWVEDAVKGAREVRGAEAARVTESMRAGAMPAWAYWDWVEERGC